MINNGDATVAFDPWTATEAEARQATELLPEFRLWAATDLNNTVQRLVLPETSPLSQWWAAQILAENSSHIEGYGSQVLAAVARCVRHGLTPPQWLAKCFLARYDKVSEKEVASWSATEAFGEPYRPGYRAAQQRQSHLQAVEVVRIVQQYRCRCPGHPDKLLWGLFAKTKKTKATLEEVSFFGQSIIERVRNVGCSRTKAQELLAHMKSMFGEPREIGAHDLDDQPQASASTARD